MPPRVVSLSKGPDNAAPLVIKTDSEANNKKAQETFKKNPEADAYVKKLIEKGCCPIITNVAALETTKGGSALSKNETEKLAKNTDKASIEKENINPNQSSRLAEKMNLKTFSSAVTAINANPPQNTRAASQNKIPVSTEKSLVQNQSDCPDVSNKVSENKNENKTVSPVTVTTTQNTHTESKTVLQNTPSIQIVASQAKPEAANQMTNQMTMPQINVIPQVVPALNTVLLTQFIPQKGAGNLVRNLNEIKTFADFLPAKNVKQNLIEPEKLKFSTPLISTKVLAQILANKDTASLNALRAILHLFGREIENEKDETDLEGSYGLWKEYLKKIKRKKSKQALSQNRQQKTQSSDKEELGIRS
jgi:hypothetical protein